MGEHPMAINIFLLLDCLGLIFLIYALVNFWKERRRSDSRRHSPIYCEEHNFGVRIATFPAVYTSKEQNSVIPFPARYRQQAELSPEYQRGFAKPIEMQRRVISEPRASHGGK
jgi:hypothetical protein